MNNIPLHKAIKLLIKTSIFLTSTNPIPGAGGVTTPAPSVHLSLTGRSCLKLMKAYNEMTMFSD